jgi:predicted membrane-bound mannosyltransferase
MIETNTSVPSSNSWLDKPFFEQIKINGEVILFTVIIIFAIISRFYDLGTRVMSHDESLHTYYSWKLYRGEGYHAYPHDARSIAISFNCPFLFPVW